MWELIVADEPTKRSRRRVKNPETFRQRALKASTENAQPKRRHRVRGFFGRLFGPVFRPLGRLFKSLTTFRPVRWLGKLLRLIGRILLPRYIRNSWKELRLVTWPSWQQSRQLTFAVLLFAIIFGAVIAGVDYGLDKLFKHILLK